MDLYSTTKSRRWLHSESRLGKAIEGMYVFLVRSLLGISYLGSFLSVTRGLVAWSKVVKAWEIHGFLLSLFIARCRWRFP